MRPYHRHGVLVDFAAEPARDGLLRILLADGSPVPAGAIVRLSGRTAEFVVAPGGDVYLTGLKPNNFVVASWASGSCRSTSAITTRSAHPRWTGSATFHVACDVQTSFTVSLSTGGGTFSERRMSGGSAQLAYNLYRDASRLTVWSDGVGGVTAEGTNVELPVYGRIPALQNMPANVYLDTITVTITF